MKFHHRFLHSCSIGLNWHSLIIYYRNVSESNLTVLQLPFSSHHFGRTLNTSTDTHCAQLWYALKVAIVMYTNLQDNGYLYIVYILQHMSHVPCTYYTIMCNKCSVLTCFCYTCMLSTLKPHKLHNMEKSY